MTARYGLRIGQADSGTALPYVTIQYWCEIYGDCTVTPVAFRIGDRTVDPHYGGSPDFTFAVENWLEFAEQTDRYGIARITASVDVIYSDANQTRQETQTASSEINIANYLAQLPAHTEHQWQKQITGTRYINENKRQHLRLEDYTFICACGEQGESGTDTTPEAHVFSNIGHVEKEHQARGHHAFARCVCGAAEYTGYAKLEGCCDCYGHTMGELYQKGKKWYRQCAVCGSWRI